MRRDALDAVLSRLAIILIAGSLAGCSTWSAQGLTPRAAIQRAIPGVVRLTMTDSSRVDMVAPRLDGDSIRGSVAGSDRSLPVAGIAYVSFRHPDRTPTIIGVSLGVAGALFTFLAASWNH